MLRTGATEGDETMRGDIHPACHADAPHGPGHLLHRQSQCAEGGGVNTGWVGVVPQQRGKGRIGAFGVEGGVAIRPEHRGEAFAVDTAKQEVGVGDRRRSTAPVAGRAGGRARRLGTDAHARPVMEDL